MYKLIKEGKIKRDKNESTIYQGDDKNYYKNLPLNWCACSLNLLAFYKKGPFGSSLTKGMFVPETTPNRIKVYEQKNAIQHNDSIGNYYITNQKYIEMIGFAVKPLDFIVSCAGTIGEIYKLPKDAPLGIINQALMKVTLISEEISDYSCPGFKENVFLFHGWHEYHFQFGCANTYGNRFFIYLYLSRLNT